MALFISMATLLFLSSCLISILGAEAIGVSYGMLGNNLPPPSQVIHLFQSKDIPNLRLYNPDAAALAALHGSGMSLVLGTLNQDLQNLAADPSFAAEWVSTNVTPHAEYVHFAAINAGNEVIPGPLASYVLPAMQNIDTALRHAGLSIPVTTSVATAVLGSSFPPSKSSFSSATSPIMNPIVSFLASNNYPLLVNIYPYFAYAGNPSSIDINYALFKAEKAVVQDGQLQYTNLFDAMLDSVYAALEKAGGAGVEVVVSETGWPSGGGGDATTVENARLYNENVVKHVAAGGGTPRRPGKKVETYLFAMFNENLKPQGIEQNFGLFFPDMTEVYHIDFIS